MTVFPLPVIITLLYISATWHLRTNRPAGVFIYVTLSSGVITYKQTPPILRILLTHKAQDDGIVANVPDQDARGSAFGSHKLPDGV